jgi:hypothetical protein
MFSVSSFFTCDASACAASSSADVLSVVDISVRVWRKYNQKQSL